MVTLHFTDQGKSDTFDLNLIGMDELQGEFMQWTFRGSLAQFKLEESQRTSPSNVLLVCIEMDEGEQNYYVDNAAELEKIEFGEKWVEIVGAEPMKR